MKKYLFILLVLSLFSNELYENEIGFQSKTLQKRKFSQITPQEAAQKVPSC